MLKNTQYMCSTPLNKPFLTFPSTPKPAYNGGYTNYGATAAKTAKTDNSFYFNINNDDRRSYSCYRESKSVVYDRLP